MPLYEVSVLQTFRMKYVIEGESLEHAYDEVTCLDSGKKEDIFDELSQKFLGSQIIDGKEISKDEFLDICERLKADKNEMANVHCGDAIIRKIVYKS